MRKKIITEGLKLEITLNNSSFLDNLREVQM